MAASPFRAISLFSSVYALVDVSLELAAERNKKPWHHLLAAMMAGAVQSRSAGNPVFTGALVGAAIGAASLPAWIYAYKHQHSASLLQLIEPKRKTEQSVAPMTPDHAANVTSSAAPEATLAPPTVALESASGLGPLPVVAAPLENSPAAIHESETANVALQDTTDTSHLDSGSWLMLFWPRSRARAPPATYATTSSASQQS